MAPEGQRTWKTIAGAVACRWVVHPGWVEEMVRQNGMVEEQDYGSKVRLSAPLTALLLPAVCCIAAMR